MATETYLGPTQAEREFYRKNGHFIIENAIEPIGLDRVQRAYEKRESETKDEWLEVARSDAN